MRRLHNTHGFTLVELILVMVLIGILSVVIVVPLLTGARAWSELTRQNEVAQQARIGLERFVREIRMVKQVGGYPAIVQVSPTSVQFMSLTGENITYSWDGSAGSPLVRTIDGVPDNAALNVQNFQLLYYEDSNALLPQFRQEAETASCAPGACTVAGDDVILASAGETAFYDFTGTRVALIGPKGTDLGIADVIVDTNPTGGAGFPLPAVQIDQYASAAGTGELLYASPQLDYGDYTVTVSYTGTKNSAATLDEIAIDAFDLIVSRIVVELEVGKDEFVTRLRDQVSFRRMQ